MPVDASPAQSEAARINGAQSRGPTSDDGKARSAVNATSHGLASVGFALRPDEELLLTELAGALMQRYRPRDAAAAEVVASLARIALLHRRLEELEMVVMSSAVGFAWMELEELAAAAQPRLPSLATICRYRARLQCRERDMTGQLAAMQAEAPHSAVPAPAATAPIPPTPRPAAGRCSSRTDEPEPAASRPLNRHERRRREALQRAKAKAA